MAKRLLADGYGEGEFSPREKAAMQRMHAAFAAGNIEEGVDAMASLGLIEVRVNEHGGKEYMMTEEVAAMVRPLVSGDDGDA